MKHFENNAFNSEQDKIKFIAKSAAWLPFHFVSTHPFSDGNGRMCQLPGNYVFSLITTLLWDHTVEWTSPHWRQLFVDSMMRVSPRQQVEHIISPSRDY